MQLCSPRKGRIGTENLGGRPTPLIRTERRIAGFDVNEGAPYLGLLSERGTWKELATSMTCIHRTLQTFLIHLFHNLH